MSRTATPAPARPDWEKFYNRYMDIAEEYNAAAESQTPRMFGTLGPRKPELLGANR